MNHPWKIVSTACRDTEHPSWHKDGVQLPHGLGHNCASTEQHAHLGSALIAIGLSRALRLSSTVGRVGAVCLRLRVGLRGRSRVRGGGLGGGLGGGCGRTVGVGLGDCSCLGNCRGSARGLACQALLNIRGGCDG